MLIELIFKAGRISLEDFAILENFPDLCVVWVSLVQEERKDEAYKSEISYSYLGTSNELLGRAC